MGQAPKGPGLYHRAALEAPLQSVFILRNCQPISQQCEMINVNFLVSRLGNSRCGPRSMAEALSPIRQC
jgi:hypothetical protein